MQNKAVESFADWLATLTVQKEAAHGGAGCVKIVLCGHRYAFNCIRFPFTALSPSMGGLLVADSIYEFIHTRPDTDAPLWPNVVACLAFDTPVLPPSSTGISALLIKHRSIWVCTRKSSKTPLQKQLNMCKTFTKRLRGYLAHLVCLRESLRLAAHSLLRFVQL